MPVSLFDIFSIGIGPSSSHTVGPMRAALKFLQGMEDCLPKIDRVHVELFGSLAMTGKGHATDVAILLGLEGETPEGVDPDSVPSRIDAIENTHTLNLLGRRKISFDQTTDLIFHKGKRLPYHSNAMRLKVFDEEGHELGKQIFYSVGGGFIQEHEQIFSPPQEVEEEGVAYPFYTAAELLGLSEQTDLTIPEIILENEKTWRSEGEIRSGILGIWQVMQDSVERGSSKTGVLPGGLNVPRRAFALREKLLRQENNPSSVFDWISLYALAVNEENAAGGRIVTAPTNGAAGVIPAVLHYYKHFTENPTEEGVIRFFLTATAIGILYKENASFSAAEMGCQGEVGVACSMAAGALVSALEGTKEEIENAAEIGMEHNLGLTCDPVGGLVQIPCIERNTMGSIKAVNAARLAMHGSGEHHVSLDQVIKTMFETGQDMKAQYKETSEGGLALHVPVSSVEC